MLIRAYEHRTIETALKYYLESAVKSIFFYCNQQNWNIDEAIRMKHKYNRRHNPQNLKLNNKGDS